jgi:hypothetical protein
MGDGIMAWQKNSRGLAPSDEPVVILTDDGGSGLYEGCRERFSPPEFEVTCDARHTVWVKRTDGSRSVGLPPWVLRQQTWEEALQTIEKKLEVPVA